MDPLCIHDQSDRDKGYEVEHGGPQVLRDLDPSIIAHWAESFAADESAALEQALESIPDEAYGLWLLSLGFKLEQVFECSEAIDGCPWTASEEEPASIVKSSFGASFAGTISDMASQCIAIYRVFHYGHWFQIYVLEGSQGPRLMAGGPPNHAPVSSEEFASSSWEVPYLLGSLYKAHDGFGPMENAASFWFEDAILPSAALAPLTRYIHFGEDIAYNPADCLMFSPDGGGNGFCFQRSGLSDKHPSLVFWGCQDRELVDGPDFLGLLKQLTATK